MGAREEDVVPEAVIDAMGKTLSDVRDLEGNLKQFLSMAEPDVLAELSPLHRAHVFLILAKCTSILFSVRLRCSGIRPEDHSLRSELERISVCEEKFLKCSDWSKAPLRPSTTLNFQAATRFIEHSLPGLTHEQRKSMKEISRRKGVSGRSSDMRGARKKRRHESVENKSVRTAAQEFLEKAALELLGPSSCGLKGPLRDIASDEEEAQAN
ncbi:sas10/Utp3/C1D family [Wolffia australiana]